MPTIATQTDPCVDVIDKLNQEFAEIQDELLDTQKQLKEEQLESALAYHTYCLGFVLDEFQNKLASVHWRSVGFMTGCIS